MHGRAYALHITSRSYLHHQAKIDTVAQSHHKLHLAQQMKREQLQHLHFHLRSFSRRGPPGANEEVASVGGEEQALHEVVPKDTKALYLGTGFIGLSNEEWIYDTKVSISLVSAFISLIVPTITFVATRTVAELASWLR